MKFLLIIHVAMGAVAPTQLAPARLAATARRTRAARAGCALDRLAAATDSSADSGDTDSGDSEEALDALCEMSERPDGRLEVLRISRLVKKRLRETNLPTSCPAVLPDDVAITYLHRLHDRTVTVKRSTCDDLRQAVTSKRARGGKCERSDTTNCPESAFCDHIPP